MKWSDLSRYSLLVNILPNLCYVGLAAAHGLAPLATWTATHHLVLAWHALHAQIHPAVCLAIGLAVFVVI